MAEVPVAIRDRITEFRRVRASELVPNPHNWREHPDSQRAVLRGVLEEIGIADVALVRKLDDGRFMLVDGHLRSEELGEREIPVVVLDLDEGEAEKLLLTLDPLAGMAKANKDVLGALLKAHAFQSQAVQGLMEDLAQQHRVPVVTQGGLTDADAASAAQAEEEAETQVGDIWLLGPHRLLCGDCTVPDQVAFLMSDRKADCMLTDPPYGVDIASKADFLPGARRRVVENDALKPSDYRGFFTSFLKAARMADHNTAYVFMSGQELHSLRLAFDDAGWRWGDYLIWVKQQHVLGRKDYQPKHEWVVAGRKPTAEEEAAPPERLEEFVVYGWKGTHRFYGGFRTTIFECDRPHRSELHPTMKPVKLLVDFVNDGTPPGGLVYDPFSGSGSTLIACQETGRVCYGAELTRRYCDVIVKRWEGFTGEKATRLRRSGAGVEVGDGGAGATGPAGAAGA